MNHYLLLTLLILSLFSVSGCGNKDSQENVARARTQYESLNLETPESAIDVFTDAFQREDYYTVYLILSPSAQFAIANSINTLDYERLIKLNNYAEAEGVLANTPQFQPIDEWEHRTSTYLFDSIMLAAKQHSAFLIDLSGAVSISRSESQNDGSQVNVYTSVEGIEGDVIFRMERAPSGRWRVRQVIVPGGDEGLIPWSVPSQ